MYHKLFALCLFSTLATLLNGQNHKEPTYLAPIRLSPSFSGGFGELRRNHFHTGLDFRTGGQTGLPVYATSEGTVGRLSVSPTGYGNALYLVHPDGRTSVYGHLSRFLPSIERYLIEQQYSLKQFAVDLTIPAGLFSFKKGDIIAWSGNSGSSGGPHLHFEIRDSQSEKPQNPLFFLKEVIDKSPPRIISLYLYSLSENGYVGKNSKKIRIETISAHSKTSLKNQLPIDVFGEIGIGMQCDDDFNGTGMKCGIFSAELFLDRQPEFSFKMDHLAFDQGRYVNSHIDYEELIKNKIWIHRLYLQPGNQMDIYQTHPNRGVLELIDGRIHDVKIVASDAFGNSTTIQFRLGSKSSQTKIPIASFTKLFKYNTTNKFEDEEVKILLPEGTLYDHLHFDYKSIAKSGSFLSKIHQIHHSEIPVHQPYLLSIKTRDIPYQLQSKALIVQISADGSQTAIGGDYVNNWLTAHPRAFGNFVVTLDTIPPVIKPIYIPGMHGISNSSKIELKISDNLSGIANYEGIIDGKWALFEFDAKTGKVVYAIDKSRLSPGKKHSLQFTAKDARNNCNVYKTTFIYN